MMNFKNKLHSMIDTLSNEQIICLVNMIESFQSEKPALVKYGSSAFDRKDQSVDSKQNINIKIHKSTYNVQDIMNILKIGRNSAYNLMKTNYFPAIRIGKTIRIPKEPFDNWMEKCNTPLDEEN